MSGWLSGANDFLFISYYLLIRSCVMVLQHVSWASPEWTFSRNLAYTMEHFCVFVTFPVCGSLFCLTWSEQELNSKPWECGWKEEREWTGLCWKKAISQSYFFSLSLSALHRTIHEYLYAKDCELFMHKQKHSVMHIKFFGNLNRAEIHRQWFVLHTRETRRMNTSSLTLSACKNFCTSKMYAVHVFDDFFFFFSNAMWIQNVVNLNRSNRCCRCSSVIVHHFFLLRRRCTTRLLCLRILCFPRLHFMAWQPLESRKICMYRHISTRNLCMK